MAQSKAQRVEDREAVWDIAHQDNIERIHAAAIIENDHIDALIEDAERYNLGREVFVELDKRILTIITDELENIDFSSPSFNTKEARKIHDDFYDKFISLVNLFERDVAELK